MCNVDTSLQCIAGYEKGCAGREWTRGDDCNMSFSRFLFKFVIIIMQYTYYGPARKTTDIHNYC